MNKLDQQVIDNLEKHLNAVREQADMTLQPPKDLLPYPKPDADGLKFHTANNAFSDGLSLREECYFNKNSSYYFNWENFSQKQFDTVMEFFDKALEAWKEKAEIIKQQNKEIIEHNTLQFNRIQKLMKVLRVYPERTEYIYKTSRSRNMTKKVYKAGYLDDLKRVLPMKDCYEEDLKRITDKRAKVEAFGLKKLKEAAEIKLAKEKEQAEEVKIQELAFLRTKYTPKQPTSYVDAILDTILSKNKYLYLAHYLEQNRNDWSDGASYAEVGLESFFVEDEIDSLIEAEITQLIEGWGGDGRCFRDCTYNYTTLYGMVEDEDLMSDYQIITKYIE